MAQSLFKLAGLDRQVPDFSTISRRQKYLSVTVGVQPTTTGLHLLIDSRESRCWGKASGRQKKHGADYRRQWRKVHLRNEKRPDNSGRFLLLLPPYLAICALCKDLLMNES